MNETHPKNIDYIVMEASQKLSEHIGKDTEVIKTRIPAKDADNSFTKTLGILQSGGVYSMMLYLMSEVGGVKEAEINSGKQKDKLCCVYTGYYAWNLIRHTVLDETNPDEADKLYLRHANKRRTLLENVMTKLCQEPRKTIFAKTVLERFLTYARYNAKALITDENI